MPILLLGRDGQVGRELTRSLLPLGQVIALGRPELDLLNLKALKRTLEDYKPQIIVNAAAYTAVDKAESDKVMADTVNSKAVAVIADYAKKQDALLIHYSTDYVFDGNKQGAYQETDRTNPLNVYGISKLAGEYAILSSGCQSIIFRTSWVFSTFGHNFIKTILNLARQKEQLSIIDDQHGAPTSAELIADVTALAIAAYRQQRLLPGLYHLTAGGVTSWYGLAVYLLNQAITHKIDFRLEPSRIEPIFTEAYPLPAIRPKNSRLDTSLISSSLHIRLPDWSIYVDRMLTQLIQMRFFA